MYTYFCFLVFCFFVLLTAFSHRHRSPFIAFTRWRWLTASHFFSSRIVQYSHFYLVRFFRAHLSWSIYLYVRRPPKTTWRQKSWTDSSYCLVFVSCRHFSPTHIKICSSTSGFKSVFPIGRIVDQPVWETIDALTQSGIFQPVRPTYLNEVRMIRRTSSVFLLEAVHSNRWIFLRCCISDILRLLFRHSNMYCVFGAM